MKKLLLLLPLIFLSCEKEPIPQADQYDVTVWTNESEPWTLYIDENKIGQIRKPYPITKTEDIPSCGDDRFTNVKLSKGRHHYNLRMTLPSGQLIMSDYKFFEVTDVCTILRATQ